MADLLYCFNHIDDLRRCVKHAGLLDGLLDGLLGVAGMTIHSVTMDHSGDSLRETHRRIRKNQSVFRLVRSTIFRSHSPGARNARFV